MIKLRPCVGAVTLGIMLLSSAMQAETVVGTTGVAVTVYGNPTFIYVGGSFETNSLNFQKDLGPLPWPATNLEPTNGPVFNRDKGWSAMLAGQLEVPKAGQYRFAQAGDLAELWVNGRKAGLDGKSAVTLPSGTVPFKLFVKSATPPQGWTMKVHVTWRGPGTSSFGNTMGGTAATPSISSSAAVGVPDSPGGRDDPPDTNDFREIDPSLLMHTQSDASQKTAFRFDFPLKKGATSFYNYRDYTIDAPEDGCYEFIAQFDSMPENTILWLDGKQIFYLQTRLGVTEYGLEFRHNARVTRYLTKGRHVVRLLTHPRYYAWVDDIDRILASSRFGVSRVVSADPEQTRSIVIKDRDDMVFRKGEPLVIRVEQATEALVKYQAQVRKQRAGGQALWTGEVALKGGAKRTTGEFVYPCDQAEGGFEITVTDDKSQVVAGPWAFVVVDTTPVSLPVADKGYDDHKILVDSVDCLLTNDPEHKFRDNGTSRVMESPVGKYRVTGDRDLYSTGYVQDKAGKWHKTQPGEYATANFSGMDWFAYTLKVKNPGRPHMVVVEYPNDIHRLTSVFAFDPVTGLSHAGLFESGDAPASAPFARGSFIAWPNTNALDVIAINTGYLGSPMSRQSAARRIELYELSEGIPANPAPVAGWKSGKEFGWTGEQTDLGMEQATMPKVWEGGGMVPGNGSEWPVGYYDWEALFTVWDRCGQYAMNRGVNLVCWPVHAYTQSMIQNAWRTPRYWGSYTRGWKARLVDPFEREQFKMMLLLCEKYRLQFVMDFWIPRELTAGHILATDTKKQYGPEGLFINEQSLPIGNPAHPLVRQYMVDMVGEYAKQYGGYKAFQGIYTRQWGESFSHCLDCWYTSDLNGYDDINIQAFEKETGLKIPVSNTGANKLDARRNWILANIKEPWLTWRCQKCLTLREAMTAEIQKYAPQARMYSCAKPTRESGLDPEQVKGRRDLGFGNRANFINQDAHIEIGRIDPVDFANFDVREPASLRRSLTNLLGEGGPFHWGNWGGYEYPRNFYAADCALRIPPYQLKEPAEALAAGQMETIFYSGTWMLPPMDEGARKFAQAWRAIPDLKYRRLGDDGTCGELGFGAENFKVESTIKGPLADEMVICWQARNDSGVWPFGKRVTIFYLVNRTPYPQTVDVTFDGAVSSVRDMVTGKDVLEAGRLSQTGCVVNSSSVAAPVTAWIPSTATASPPRLHETAAVVTVDPYMPAVFSAAGAKGVSKVEVLTTPQELAALERGVQHLRAMAPRAEGTVQVLRGRGERYVVCKYGLECDDKEWARRDVKVAFTNLLAPVESAWQQKKYGRVRDLLDKFLVKDNWWYQILGWPQDQYVYRIPTGAYATPKALFPAMKADDLALVKTDGVPWGEVVQASKGKATFIPKVAAAGKYELRVWLVAGENASPIDVAVNGNKVGTIASSPGKLRLVHGLLVQPIGLPFGTPAIALESKSALAISAIELTAVPPEPIRAWSVLGVFDTREQGYDGFSKAFPPDKGIDLAAEYDGMGGKKIKWQQIDIGEDKFIQLLEKYYQFDYVNGTKGLGYLATWVYSPDERDATLYYASDWFLQVWVNGSEVIHYVTGPWMAYGTKTVHLKAGWNELRAKCMPGRTSWKAAFALSDPGDLRYRSTPFEP